MNKQQKEVMQAQLDNEKAVLKKLEQNYADALAEIDDKIAILLGRQDADMQHVIYQVEYQKALKTQIQAILETLQANEFETVSEYLTQSYEEGFIGTMYDLQSQGIPLIFPIDQKQVVDAIQNETKLTTRTDTKTGKLYASLGDDINDLKKKITGEISRGLSSGQMYSEISRNISSWARIPKNNAMRIARTESHRIQNKAAMDVQTKAKEKGADIVKQWDATLDSKTRSSHRKLDGQIRELEEEFEVNGHKAMMPGGFGRPEEDINCRCALLQRARWALGNDYTKWDEDAPVVIDDDGTTQFTIVDANSYKEFKGYYKDITGQMTMNLVRSSTPKIKSQGTLEKTGKSSIIKAITVDDLVKATEGGAVKQEVAREIGTLLERHSALKLFDKTKTANLGDAIVFQTNPQKVGTFFDAVFEINEDMIGGMTIEEIDQLFKGATNTVCDSLEDAIVHETYHAKLINGLNYANVENLYAELEEIHIEGLSQTAYKDGAECIAEVGVLIERGDKDKVPKAALELFERYMGENND